MVFRCSLSVFVRHYLRVSLWRFWHLSLSVSLALSPCPHPPRLSLSPLSLAHSHPPYGFLPRSLSRFWLLFLTLSLSQPLSIPLSLCTPLKQLPYRKDCDRRLSVGRRERVYQLDVLRPFNHYDYIRERERERVSNLVF